MERDRLGPGAIDMEAFSPGSAEALRHIRRKLTSDFVLLAGDTISIPPIGCVLALALANTVPPGCQNAMPILLDDHHLPATWVGPSSWRGFDHSADNLY